MRKSFILFLFAVLLSMINGVTGSATSWDVVDPQEVVNRADVIVMGKYDFTSEPIPSEHMFQGLDFAVTTVFKGEVPEGFKAGIDYNDAGWADEFQKEGGEFLLFLEKSQDADFLIPVGGPNGMIQVSEGRVEEHNGKKTFYEKFLKSHTPQEKAIESDLENQDENQNESQDKKSYSIFYISAGILVSLAVLFLLYRYKKRK